MTMTPPTPNQRSGKKLERCGYCGQYFRENEYCTIEELKSLSEKELNEVPLGYCPNAQQEDYENAQQEDYEQNPENYLHQVTRDMAIDAGDLSLEGTWI